MKPTKILILLAIFILATAIVQAECNDKDYDGYGEGCDAGIDCDDNNPLVYDGAIEICDLVDNDCDGIEDNPGCIPIGLYCFANGETKQCGSTDVGECSFGTQTCTAHEWSDCAGEIESIEEVCGDELDNDCDGEVDNGCVGPQDTGSSSSSSSSSSGGGGGRSTGGIPPECLPFYWNCNAAEWSKCNPLTNEKTRNVDLCVYEGPEKDNLGRSCEDLTKQSREGIAQCFPIECERNSDCTSGKECRNGKCVTVSESECRTNLDCKEGQVCINELCFNEEKGFPWWIIILILVGLLVAGGVTYAVIKLRKKGVGKVGPFKKEADLKAVINYIKSAKMRKVPDATITKALMSSGWTVEQIKFASQKMAQQLKQSAVKK